MGDCYRRFAAICRWVVAICGLTPAAMSCRGFAAGDHVETENLS